MLAQKGELPLVIAAPHGGGTRPTDWPVREGGVHVRDTNTYPIGIALAEAIRRRTGRSPSLVASRVHRRHLDLNRDETESGAKQGPQQRQLWEDYHGSIEQACEQAKELGNGQALLIDLHGHGHDHGLIELGFAVSASELRKADEDLPRAKWIRGATSLGAQLEQRGWSAVPSPNRPAPLVGQAYFNGGYTVRRHRGDGLRSIQIELPPHPRRLSAAERQGLVEGLAEAILGLLHTERMIRPLQLKRVTSENFTRAHWSAKAWQSAKAEGVTELANALPSVVDVMGIPIFAGPEVSESSHLALANRLLNRLDGNQDGILDELDAMLELQSNRYAIVVYAERPPELSPASRAKLGSQFSMTTAERFDHGLDPRVPRARESKRPSGG